jgi:prevent-host-death family protein
MYNLSKVIIMQIIPFSEARAHLAETLHQLETDQHPLLISRRGKAAAVLISPAQYQQLIGADQGFAARLAQWRTDYASDLPEVDPFTQLRDSTQGRDFSW